MRGLRFAIKEVDRGWDALKKMAKTLQQGDSFAKVGFLEEGPGGQGHSDGLTNGALGAIHEFGAPSVGIPERSFIRSTFEERKPEYLEILRKRLPDVYAQRLNIERLLNLLGAKAAADIKKRVTAGDSIPPPNAPATVAQKGSDRTLVDTGRMVGAISYAVVISGKKAS